MFDLVFYICDILAHCVLFALDLQFLYFCMVLCKRYRLVNKVGMTLFRPYRIVGAMETCFFFPYSDLGAHHEAVEDVPERAAA